MVLFGNLDRLADLNLGGEILRMYGADSEDVGYLADVTAILKEMIPHGGSKTDNIG